MRRCSDPVAEDFASLPTPVATSLDAWAAWPDVLADYHQQGEAGVWTRPSEILPGRRVRTTPPLVAAWGEMTWAAVEAAEQGDPHLIWLQPVTGPADVVDPQAAHDPDRLIADVLDDLR